MCTLGKKNPDETSIVATGHSTIPDPLCMGSVSPPNWNAASPDAPGLLGNGEFSIMSQFHIFYQSQLPQVLQQK